jgi:hypothetical protein
MPVPTTAIESPNGTFYKALKAVTPAPMRPAAFSGAIELGI